MAARKRLRCLYSKERLANTKIRRENMPNNRRADRAVRMDYQAVADSKGVSAL